MLAVQPQVGHGTSWAQPVDLPSLPVVELVRGPRPRPEPQDDRTQTRHQPEITPAEEDAMQVPMPNSIKVILVIGLLSLLAGCVNFDQRLAPADPAVRPAAYCDRDELSGQSHGECRA